jgi:hypothetical protein
MNEDVEVKVFAMEPGSMPPALTQTDGLVSFLIWSLSFLQSIHRS